ncbi:tripartite tricarboxylate transporter TctB family protein [Marinivivus vitaminiproducens]|uniref:tripartite tricarboxylate transporter TctB family protein n=1 Tax=Marinivivus vitaminiproducens TaxID=3035935 RepID=UPI0027A34A6F|nr:tripartite tricarboxylate transporter TctB family protein [Geminicoccaceae bacterium SCSIO 64248]
MTTTSGRGLRLAEAAFAVAVLALGLFVAFETTQIHTARSNAPVGPALFPYIVAAGLILVGLFALREAFAGKVAHADEAGFELDWKAIVIASLGLLVHLLIVEDLGWLVATTVLFALVARAFGSRRLMADLALGLVLALLTFGVFNYGLDLSLPVGTVWEDLIDSMAADEPA